MAVRLHATAVRDCPVDEVRATFREILGPGFDAVEVREHGGWAWFTTSVWGVAGDALNKGLCRLARPALQFTTADADRWYLTVHGGPDGPRSFLHQFWHFRGELDPARDAEMAENARREEPEPIDPALEFLEDEPKAPARPRSPFDEVADEMAGCGGPIPEALVEEWRDLPYSQAMARFRAWYADALPRALADAGIPVDQAAVRRVLLWEGVTERERDNDVGNLHRLLAALGLGGEWAEYVAGIDAQVAAGNASGYEPQAECPIADGPPPEPPPDHAAAVLELVSDRPLTPVEGGPVPLEPRRLARLGFPSEACSTEASPMMAVLVRLPDDPARRPLKAPRAAAEEIRLTPLPDGFRLGLRNRKWCVPGDLKEQVGARATRLLFRPPDGTEIEADFAVPDEPATYQRYRGTVREGALWIERTHPPLTHQALADALEIAAHESRTRITCRDEAEAIALEAAALRDSYLHDMDVKRRGATVRVEFDVGNLAKLLLRHRQPSAWDFGPVLAHEAKEYEERIAQAREFRRMSVEAARRRAAPHDPEFLYVGRHTRYWRSDFLQLEPLDQEPRQRFDEAMAALGFTHVGDLVAKKQRDIVLRVFLSDDRLCYGVLMAKRTMYLGQEIVSRLADGSGLTTTTNATVDSHPEAGIYYRVLPGLDAAALHEKHREGLGRFRARKGLEAVPLAETLAGVAGEIEIAFGRLANVTDD